MKIFGYICFSILLASIFVFIGLKTGDGFMFDFINSSSINIAVTLLGFNIAIHTILVGQITDIEIHHNKLGHLKGTRKELRENAVSNIFLVILMFVFRLLKLGPGSVLGNIINSNMISTINFILEILVLACIIFIMSLIFETITAVYKIYDSKGR